jgi:3-hydroxyisobutyrate dehydrogenase-like beta-hydroxyacid dehydrogenase
MMDGNWEHVLRDLQHVDVSTLDETEVWRLIDYLQAKSAEIIAPICAGTVLTALAREILSLVGRRLREAEERLKLLRRKARF